MSKQPHSINGLFEAFGTVVAFAESIGCGYEAARKMRRRGSIAARHWPSIVAAAASRGIPGVTLEWLATQHLSDGCQCEDVA